MTSRRLHPSCFGLALAALLVAGNTAFAAPTPEPLTHAVALQAQSRVWEQASQLREERPEWAAQIDQSHPSRSRTGSLVFSPSQIDEPQAATLLVARSGQSHDPNFRRAVAEALPETKSTQLGALIASELALESSPLVRVSLTHALRYASDAPAEPALLLALQDQDPQVRETALASMRAHPQAEHFGSAILAACQDPNPRVQAAALRAWGTLRDPALKLDIETWLASESGKVRLAALRGQSRVDRALARDLVLKLELQEDPDPKVARLASRLVAR